MRKTNDETILSMLKDGKPQKEIAEYFNVSPAAISKRVKRLVPPPKSLEQLTDKEKKFAVGLASGKTKTVAALEAFDTSTRESAKTLGIKLMEKPSVNAAIADLMEFHGMGRSYRVGKLKQHVDNIDAGISLKALDQSWKLDGYQEDGAGQTINYNQRLTVLIAESKLHWEETVGSLAELAWIDGQLTHEDFKRVLKQLAAEISDIDLENIFRWLLELDEIPEAEIEERVREFNRGITGFGTMGADATAI